MYIEDDPTLPPDKRKVYRRKKVSIGQSIMATLEARRDQLELAKRDKGLLCRECHKLRLWKELDAHYGYDIGTPVVWRSWVCLKCGNTLREDRLVLEELE